MSRAGWIAGASTLAASAGALAYATLSAEAQWFGPVLTAPPNPDKVALTFDDGPNPEATPRLLDVLARHGVRATFFLIGNFACQQPALVRRITAEGHLVGNHTMTHPWLPLIAPSRQRAEIVDCSRLLEDLLGQPVTLFRPPHGARTPAVLRIVRDAGMQTMHWNVIVQDWKPVGADVIYARLTRKLAANRRRRLGSTVVLHDGGHSALGEPRLATVTAVERLLAGIDEDTLAPPGNL